MAEIGWWKQNGRNKLGEKNQPFPPIEKVHLDDLNVYLDTLDT